MSDTNIADLAEIDSTAYITVNGSSTSGWNTAITFTDDNGTEITFPTPEEIAEIKKDIRAIKQRLAILDDPDPEKLKKHKALKKAYDKYKMLEKLCGASNE